MVLKIKDYDKRKILTGFSIVEAVGSDRIGVIGVVDRRVN